MPLRLLISSMPRWPGVPVPGEPKLAFSPRLRSQVSHSCGVVPLAVALTTSTMGVVPISATGDRSTAGS